MHGTSSLNNYLVMVWQVLTIIITTAIASYDGVEDNSKHFYLDSNAKEGCTPSMNNTVVYEGNSTSFSKAAADTGPVRWAVEPSSTSSTNTINPNSDTIVEPRYNASYAVTSTQLIILDATSAGKGSNPHSTAGVYLMSTDGGGNSYCQGATLTVISE